MIFPGICICFIEKTSYTLLLLLAKVKWKSSLKKLKGRCLKMSILIRNVWLNGENEDVFIDNGVFEKIGADLNVEAKTVIDANGMAILPSFHNAHTHAAMTLMRGYADDLELHKWLSQHIWPFESRITEEDVYNGARLACLEMIKSGTTFFNDMYWYYHSTARAVEEMGLRAELSAVLIDNFDSDKARQQREYNARLLEETEQYSDRIKFALGPHAIYTVSEDSLRWCAEFAEENDLQIHLHLSETEKEVADCKGEHDLLPVEYLNQIGVLGPNVVAVHMVWVAPEEIDLLAENQVRIAHCPTSNMKLCSGKFPYSTFAEEGFQIAIGTDGCSSNNNLDMGEELKIAALHEKSVENEPTALPAEECFRLGTESSAGMFGLNGGIIAEGRLADCILVDLDNERLVPGHDLISDIVYSADSSCIDTTICAGKVLMRNRKVEGEQEIVAAARESTRRLAGG